MKIVTTMVRESRSKYPNPKDKHRITVAQAVEKVNTNYASNVSYSTACRCIKEGRINKSPSHPGPNGKFPMSIRKAIVGAYQTYISLTQAEGRTQVTQKEMARRLELLLKPAGPFKSRQEAQLQQGISL